MEYFTEARLKKSLMGAGVALLSVAVIFCLISIVHNLKGDKGYTEPTITISGTGKIVTKPDIAKISFTIEEKSKNMTDAQKTVTDKGNTIIASLKNMGILESDIKTDGYTANPEYEWKTKSVICPIGSYCPTDGHQELVGYMVSHSLSVKVRDTAKLGDVTRVLTENKVTNINGPMFEVDDIEAIKTEARSVAIADARAKAKIMARDLGVHLGRVISFYDNAEVPMPIAYGATDMMVKSSMGAAMAPAPVIPTGENTITSNVSVTFKIR